MKLSLRILNWLIISYWLSILFVSVITLNGSMALNKQKVFGFRNDYLLHVVFFIPWMILAKWRWRDHDSKTTFWYVLGIGLMLAAFSEAIQLFLPNRTFNIFDLAANSLGILLGAMVSGWGGAKRQARG